MSGPSAFKQGRPPVASPAAGQAGGDRFCGAEVETGAAAHAAIGKDGIGIQRDSPHGAGPGTNGALVAFLRIDFLFAHGDPELHGARFVSNEMQGRSHEVENLW